MSSLILLLAALAHGGLCEGEELLVDDLSALASVQVAVSGSLE